MLHYSCGDGIIPNFLFYGFIFTVFQSSTDQFRKNFQLQNLRNEIPRGEIQERLWNTVNP